MNTLESMERQTPEFQKLTDSQQIKRRQLLLTVIDNLTSDPESFGLTPQQAFVFTCNLLEFHLTGTIEKGITNPPRLKKNKK